MQISSLIHGPVENIFPLVHPWCPSTYGMSTAVGAVERKREQRCYNWMSPFGTHAFFQAWRKNILCASYRLRTAPYHQLRGFVIKCAGQLNQSHKINDHFHIVSRIPRTGAVHIHCTVTRKIVAPKVPTSSAHSPLAQELLCPCCLNSCIH